MLKPTSALSGYFNNDPPPLATDGRFSGGSKGVLVAHLPDAYKGVNITNQIKSGNLVELDLNNGTINVLDDVANDTNVKKINLDGYLEKYRKLVTNIENGYLT